MAAKGLGTTSGKKKAPGLGTKATTPKKSNPTPEEFVTEVVRGKGDGLTKKAIADNLGMEIATFNQRYKRYIDLGVKLPAIGRKRLTKDDVDKLNKLIGAR